MKDIDWNAMSAPWLKAEALLESAHQTVLDGLLHRARLKAGQRVLDIGCGTGASLLAAAELVGPEGLVVGVDIAPPLAARAKERVPENVTVLVGDAGTLSHDRSFDAVISLFGTMFFADTQSAFTTIRKAIDPGTPFVFSAWAPPPRNPWFGIPRASVEAQVGALPRPDPQAPGPFRFANADATMKEIGSAGWDVEVETESLVLRTDRNAESLADMHLVLAEALLLNDHDISEADRTSIWKNLRDGFGELAGGDAVEVPAEIHFFTATASN
ncbi:MAG: class I SAM-dependent methyltransferase [Silicimonas sp.]|nr:class I SAM-dependent methyltransferase [Silicimonas sp.]